MSTIYKTIFLKGGQFHYHQRSGNEVAFLHSSWIIYYLILEIILFGHT
jgi:hypothetical protein